MCKIVTAKKKRMDIMKVGPGLAKIYQCKNICRSVNETLGVIGRYEAGATPI